MLQKLKKRRRSKFQVRDQLRAFPLSYGGELFKSRKGRRRGGRPLEPHNTLHLVLRSRLAKGSWSFSRTPNKRRVQQLFERFSIKYGVKIYSLVCAGNHIHSQVRVSNRTSYKRFIRAVTGSITMVITGHTRWNKTLESQRFWDCRPFTRIVRGRREFTVLQDYIHLNRLETMGYTREQGRFLIEWERYARDTS